MPKAQPAHTIEFESATGVLHVTHGSFASDAQFDLYYYDLEAALAPIRATHAPVLLLIDNTSMDMVCPEAGGRIARLGNLFLPEDRIALIVRSSTLKIEMRRVAHDPTVQSFMSKNAARTWLLAYSHPIASAA